MIPRAKSAPFPEGGAFSQISPRTARWQATWHPGATSVSAGSEARHSSAAKGQRVWNRQPAGGFLGLGRSPCNKIRSRLTVGSGMGMAESSARV